MKKTIILSILMLMAMIGIASAISCVMKDFGGTPPVEGTYIYVCDTSIHGIEFCCSYCSAITMSFSFYTAEVGWCNGEGFDIPIPAWFEDGGEYFINATNNITTTPECINNTDCATGYSCNISLNCEAIPDTRSETSAVSRGDYYYVDSEGNIYTREQIEGTSTTTGAPTLSIGGLQSTNLKTLWNNFLAWIKSWFI